MSPIYHLLLIWNQYWIQLANDAESYFLDLFGLQSLLVDSGLIECCFECLFFYSICFLLMINILFNDICASPFYFEGEIDWRPNNKLVSVVMFAEMITFYCTE